MLKRLWKYSTIAALALFLASLCHAADPPQGCLSEELLSLKSATIRKEFVLRAQQGSLGVTTDAVGDLKRSFGPEVNHPEISQGIYQFESDVQRLFSIAPEHRNTKEFQKRWNLSEHDLLDLLTYYGTQVFYNDVRITGDPSTVFRRLQSISYQHYLRYSEAPAAQHFGYYMTNIPQLSVPELAVRLGLTEGQVYQELSELRISLVQAHERARPEEIGAQARAFMEHHLHDGNRGVSWTRIARFNQERSTEAEILVQLFEDSLSPVEIANQLNELFPAGAAHPEVRTEASVRAKLVQLGLTQPTPRLGLKNVLDPQYGYLKLNGALVEATATQFIFDHWDRDRSWLAGRLGVTESALQNFEKRNHIIRESGGEPRPKGRQVHFANPETQARLDLFDRQREAVDKVLEWIALNQRLPLVKELRSIVPGGEPAFLGGAEEGKRIFDRPESAWLAVKQRAIARGVPFRLLDVRLENGGRRVEEFHHALQEEALDLAASSIKNLAGNEAGSLGEIVRAIGTGQARLTGTGDYAPDGRAFSYSVFESPEAFLTQLGERCREQKIRWSYLWFEIKNGTPRWREMRQREIADKAVELISSGQLREYSLAAVAKLLDLKAQRIASDYEGREGVFAGPAEFWLAVKRTAKQRGLTLDLTDVINVRINTPEFRAELEKDALVKLGQWLRINRRSPTALDFGRPAPEGIGINYTRFFGRHHYAPEGRTSSMAIFTSPAEAELSFKDELQKVGIALLPKTPENPIPRVEQQKASVDRVVDWMVENKRAPSREEVAGLFNSAPRSSPFFGTGRYSETGELNSRTIFDRPEAAWIAIKKRAQEREVPFSLQDIPFMVSTDPAFRNALREEALDLAIEALKKKPPLSSFTQKDFSDAHVDIVRLTRGTEESRIFSNYEEFLLELGKRNEVMGTPWSYFRTDVKDASPAWVAARQKEVVTKAIQVIANGQLKELTLELLAEKIAIGAHRIVNRQSAAFDSLSDLWLAIKLEAERRNVQLDLTDVIIRSGFSPEYRIQLQKDALAKLRVWLNQHRRRPSATDFKLAPPEGIGMDYSRFFGKYQYAPDGVSPRAAIFSTPAEAQSNFEQELKNAGIE